MKAKCLTLATTEWVMKNVRHSTRMYSGMGQAPVESVWINGRLCGRGEVLLHDQNLAGSPAAAARQSVAEVADIALASASGVVHPLRAPRGRVILSQCAHLPSKVL